MGLLRNQMATPPPESSVAPVATKKPFSIPFLFPSKSKCRRFVSDDTQVGDILTVDQLQMQTPSGFCKFFVGLLVVFAVVRLVYIVKVPKNRVQHIVGLLVNVAFVLYINKHCDMCDAWMGFFKMLLLSMIVEALLAAVFMKKSDAEASST